MEGRFAGAERDEISRKDAKAQRRKGAKENRTTYERFSLRLWYTRLSLADLVN